MPFQADLEQLAHEIGATIGPPCEICRRQLYRDRKGEQVCCWCYPLHGKWAWTDDQMERIRTSPKGVVFGGGR